MTSKEVRQLLRISRNCLYKLVRTGTIPVMRCGSVMRFSRDDVLRALTGGPPREP